MPCNCFQSSPPNLQIQCLAVVPDGSMSMGSFKRAAQTVKAYSISKALNVLTIRQLMVV